MRIALYGSMANNMYAMARVLRKHGYEAFYVDPGYDLYPMSQPIWEDVELRMPSSRLSGRIPTALEWEEISRESGWHKPEWVVDPLARSNGIRRYRQALAPLARLAAGLPPRHWRSAAAYVRGRRRIITHLAGYDWIIVCGTGVVDAFLSGTPYVFWAHGGDVRIVPFVDRTPFDRAFAAMLRVALGGAEAVVNNDPSLQPAFRELGFERQAHFPFLIDCDRYARRIEAGEGLLPADVLERARGKLRLLVPSRQEFYWKATDRFIRAFLRALADGEDLFLVISRWGSDAPQVERMIAQAGAGDYVHYLDHILSKPLLARFYNWADVVVDQFALGCFGTTMLEAMGCGRPVMIGLDPADFEGFWPGFVMPPVVRARSEEEIYAAVRSLAAGRLDLEALGRAARDWLVRFHGEQQLIRWLPAGAAPNPSAHLAGSAAAT